MMRVKLGNIFLIFSHLSFETKQIFLKDIYKVTVRVSLTARTPHLFMISCARLFSIYTFPYNKYRILSVLMQLLMINWTCVAQNTITLSCTHYEFSLLICILSDLSGQLLLLILCLYMHAVRCIAFVSVTQVCYGL